MLLAALVSAISILFLACNGGGSAGGPSPSATQPTVTSTPSEDADPREAQIELREVTGGLEMPLYATHAGDGSGLVYVVEQVGRIRIVDDGSAIEEPFLDISERVQAGGEQGLLGLAFDPEYADNRHFYVNYTDSAGTTIVSRFTAKSGGNSAEADSEEVLLRIEQPYSNHNGGHITFGPDGYLYIATGDGGSGGDPHGNGQSLDTLLGKILRIDVSGENGYRIPEDNPFADDGGRPEIWAYGLRNPWRFSFDPATGDLWIGDVGQSSREEINLEPSGEGGGLNYGWNIMEGQTCFGADSCRREGLVEPVADYPHSQGFSVTGGYVYRGDAIPELRAGYLFGDYGSGKIWIIDSRRPRAGAKEVLQTGLSISSFGRDEAGEILVLDHGGRLLRVVPDD